MREPKEKQPRKIAPLRYQILTLQDVENEEISREDDTLFIVGNDGSNCACVEFTTRNCGNVEALNRFLDVYHQSEVAGIIPELILRQAGIRKEDTAFDYFGEPNENYKYTVAPTHEFFGSVQNWNDGIIDCYFYHERQEDGMHYIYIKARSEKIMEKSTLTENTTPTAQVYVEDDGSNDDAEEENIALTADYNFDDEEDEDEELIDPVEEKIIADVEYNPTDDPADNGEPEETDAALIPSNVFALCCDMLSQKIQSWGIDDNVSSHFIIIFNRVIDCWKAKKPFKKYAVDFGVDAFKKILSFTEYADWDVSHLDNGYLTWNVQENDFEPLLDSAQKFIAEMEAYILDIDTKNITRLIDFERRTNNESLKFLPDIEEKIIQSFRKIQFVLDGKISPRKVNSQEIINAVAVGRAAPLSDFNLSATVSIAQTNLNEFEFESWENKVGNIQKQFETKCQKNLMDFSADLYLIDDAQVDEMLKLPNTDAGHAERFVYTYGKTGKGIVRFIKDWAKWMLFQPPIWDISVDGSNNIVTKHFISMVRQSRRIAEDAKKKLSAQENKSDADNTKIVVLDSFCKSMHKLEDRKKYFPALETAKSYSDFLSDDLNNYPYLLNTPNGIIDLTTGELRPHDKNIFFTQCTRAEYRKGYRHNAVEKFLRDIMPDEETRDYLLKYAAYCLTGIVEKEIALFIFGSGSNGKGTFSKILQSALGTISSGFATTLSNELILQGKFPRDANAPTPEIAKLKDRRLAVIEELPRERKLDESEFKKLTGGDMLSARLLHQNPTNFEPRFKLLISGNFLPSISNTEDYALLRRIFICPFTQTFKENNCNVKLKSELMQPAAQCGLLSLLVDTCVDWLKSGAKLMPSALMENAKAKWLADISNKNGVANSDATDAVKEFMNRYCVRDSKGRITRADLFSKFRWEYPRLNISDNEFHGVVMSIDDDKNISDDLKIHYKRGNRGYLYSGIKWKVN